MKKCYLFLMMLFVQLIMGGSAFAADPPKSEYEAALAAFPSGAYYITTEIDGVKYYVTATGSVEERGDWLEASDGLFTINQVSGGALYDVGWHIEGANGHFSNTTLVDSKALLNPETGVFRLDTSNNRNDWESQVFYLNEESGKFAIRSCNTAFGESSWADAGRAFWTFQVDEVGEIVWGDYGPMPAYSYEPAYIWTLEQPAGFDQVKMIIDGLFDTYVDLIYEDPEDPDNWGLFLNMGTEFGQLADWDSYQKLWSLVQEINVISELFTAPGYDYYTDPDACTLEQANAYKAQTDSLYQAIIDSEVPYSLPNGDGFYRIKSILRYYTDTVIGQDEYEEDIVERSYVDKVMLASFENRGMFGTLRPEMANQVWKLTQKGDSILMQNAGMESYISASETPGSNNRIYLTEDANDAAYVVFDWAGEDEVDTDPLGGGVWETKETFNIRLTTKARHAGNYVHSNGHNKGKDSHSDLEVSFWNSTYGKEKYNDDGGTSEWYLEPVSEEEVAELIANFATYKDKDILIKNNNELREKVLETLTLAKDVTYTPMITNVNQMDNRYGDSSEGQNLGNLIDGDASTFWHTTWHGLADGVEPFYYYGEGYEENGLECHFLQISGMENMVGDCELYLRERDGADNDRVKTLVVMGTDNLKNEDEDWDEILRVTLPHTGKAEENTISFHMDESYPYIRLFAIDTDGSSYAFRTFWHASEIQFYTVEENPNSQFVLMGEVAQNLQDAYDANIAISDADLTPEDYQALLAAYNAFLDAGLVDPAEMRDALAKYAKVTEGAVEGTNPGYWEDMTVPNAYNDLYAEVEAYNKAGVYKADEVHKYAVMLKAMQKSVMEQANDVKTDKWYRIMVPTEEMYDAYGFSKEGVDNCNDLVEEQNTICGNFVTTAQGFSEEVAAPTDEDPDAVATKTRLETINGDDVRESDRLFFMPDEEIEDKDVSMFRFVELESDGADYTPLLQDVKENMVMALDMSTTYTQGEPLITKASQFSSNASYPGNDGQKLESGCLIDNNTATYWHSDYSKTYCVVPYLQVALNNPVSGLIQVYVARRNTSNGHVVRMYVQGSNDAETWTNIGYIETPYTNATTPATSQPLDLGGTFSHLRFTMTNRYGTDGGSNIEFDPFAENLTADDYNTKFTYFHASEFQIYPVTPNGEQSAAAKAVQEAYTVANKVVLKDATAEDVAAAAQVYKAYKDEFNAEAGKPVLPNGADKAPSTYVLQNKATGLFVMVNGTGNQNNIYLKTIPTLVGYKAMGYERSLLSAKTVDGVSCNNLHIGESNRRFCTWGSTEPTSNSGLVICEVEEEYEAPAEFTFSKDVKPGRIADWCHSVTLTPTNAPDEAVAYTAVGWYRDDDEALFLAVKAIETIPAGEPALYIYGDTLEYDAEYDDDVEAVKFTMSGSEKPVLEGTTTNGLIGTLVTYTLENNQIYFDGNHAAWPAEGQTVSVTPCSAVLDIKNCPQVDPNGEYDFSICITEDEDAADGVKDVSTAIEKISQPGNVYSMDGKLLRTGATLNSLKTMGKGMYILNGVKVVVK